VATDLHKDIDAVIEGEGVRIDKSLLELLDAPLTHMVRNAADHGIESIDERKAAGKPSTGTIVVRVRETDTEVLLEVEDDGRGLNLEAIQAAAIRHGLIRAGAELDENAIVDLIFSSGVSTAQGVSEFSGRGVGMDVVKQNIVEAGGSIGVTTMDGQGARFTIRLPKAVTTQIIPGYLVRSEGQTYVLPMDRVQETTRIHREEISFIPQRGWCLRRRGSVVPVFNLANMLNAMATTDVVVNGNEQVAIALESRGTDVALVVDQVLGVQKVVLRRIDGLPLGHTLVTGGALLGDGSVSLIIDVDGIIGSGVPTP
jgi:two-component system chemotaxis sensor kinase CheA